jgi:hypothetical protein
MQSASFADLLSRLQSPDMRRAAGALKALPLSTPRRAAHDRARPASPSRAGRR